jgi:hypothetical protein
MAVLGAASAVPVYRAGTADEVVLIALRDVTTGDTLDLGPGGINVLSFINRAVVMGLTQFVEIAASWAGTVVTMPSGLAGDVAYVLAWGSAI